MEDAKVAASLMMTKSEEKSKVGVDRLIGYNRERKRIQEETFLQCRHLVETTYAEDAFLVINLEDAHEGITGIVAGKIKETFGKPAIIVTPTADGCLKGTGRSIEGVNIYRMLKENDVLFERFGGHSAACGFTMKEEHLQELRERLNRQMEALVEANPDLMKQELKADLVLQAEEVTMEMVQDLEKLEPFGCDNPRPLVEVEVVPSNLRRMGAKQQFSKFTGILADGREVQCVIFRNAEKYDAWLQKGEKISIIGTLGVQSWNGRAYLQITVMGVK